jgi:hypothetical protein
MEPREDGQHQNEKKDPYFGDHLFFYAYNQKEKKEKEDFDSSIHPLKKSISKGIFPLDIALLNDIRQMIHPFFKEGEPDLPTSSLEGLLGG